MYMNTDSSMQWPGWLVRPQGEHWQKASEAVGRVEVGYFATLVFIPLTTIEKSYITKLLQTK